jgi:hypothetical protein
MGVLASQSMMTFLEIQNGAGRAEFGKVIVDSLLGHCWTKVYSNFFFSAFTLWPGAMYSKILHVRSMVRYRRQMGGSWCYSTVNGSPHQVHYS